MRLSIMVTVAGVLVCTGFSQTSTSTKSTKGAGGGRFVPGCQMPFQSKRTAFDNKCGIKGAGTAADKIAESKAKNNFCGNADAPVRLSSDDFLTLQKASDDLGSQKFTDRSPLHDLVSIGDAKVGEGTVVEYVAFVLDAHYSNVSKGETVNCKISGKPNNDIHIVLVQDPSDDPCTSLTAELSPHFRPTGWTDSAVNGAGKHPVRVRGQLFFDSSHQPCRGSKRASPARQSVWEIHPAYAFDVCKKTTIEDCKNATDDDWVPVDQWNAVEEEEGAGNL
jgi:hypothetical protein